MSDGKITKGLRGRKARESRLHGEITGSTSVSSHVEFLFIIKSLYVLSKEHTEKKASNVSPYVLAGIPLLTSMLRALVIDCEICALKGKRDFDCLKKGDDLGAIFDRFGIAGDLRRDAEYLQEIRNEIVHPTHVAIVEKDNWPEYLGFIKEQQLLNSTGRKDADFHFFHQLQSHRLFEWSIDVTVEISKEIIFSYREEAGWGTLKYLWKNFDPAFDVG